MNQLLNFKGTWAAGCFSQPYFKRASLCSSEINLRMRAVFPLTSCSLLKAGAVREGVSPKIIRRYLRSQFAVLQFGMDGAYINSRNLSSPIDNDWYVIDIPSTRLYDYLRITAPTSSVNTCAVEVYQNISSNEGGYQMRKVGGSGKVPVATGTYYVRVFNALSMEDFDDNDIQNYTLDITPILTPTAISITSLSGTEGEHYVSYSGYGRYFRTSTGTVTVTGYLTSHDSSTNTTYYVTNADITGMYYSPAWENNNTMDWAYVYGHGRTDSTGKYTLQISLPQAMGALSDDVGTSYHYFDLCAIYAFSDDDPSVNTYKPIYHYAYSIYHHF